MSSYADFLARKTRVWGGIGLRDVPHRVLNSRMLSALEPNADPRKPSRLLELHLTGNMESYMWSFDGQMYSAVHDVPIRFAWNERVRVKLVNNTMMAHPIHLHGHEFVVTGTDGGWTPPASRWPRPRRRASAQCCSRGFAS